MYFIKYLFVAHTVLFLISIVKLCSYKIHLNSKLDISMQLLIPIAGITTCINLIFTPKKTIENRFNEIKKENENRIKREEKNKYNEILERIRIFLGEKTSRNSDYWRSSNNGNSIHTQSSALFNQIMNLISKANGIVADKSKLDSINNYVFELFDKLIEIDPEMKISTYEILKDDIDDLIHEYNNLMVKIVKEAENINEQIAQENKKKIKQFYGSKIIEMRKILNSISEDLIEK